MARYTTEDARWLWLVEAFFSDLRLIYTIVTRQAMYVHMM